MAYSDILKAYRNSSAEAYSHLAGYFADICLDAKKTIIAASGELSKSQQELIAEELQVLWRTAMLCCDKQLEDCYGLTVDPIAFAIREKELLTLSQKSTPLLYDAVGNWTVKNAQQVSPPEEHEQLSALMPNPEAPHFVPTQKTPPAVVVNDRRTRKGQHHQQARAFVPAGSPMQNSVITQMNADGSITFVNTKA